MKRDSNIGQKSCIDISKYKFIPPAKLLKAKAQPNIQKTMHAQSLLQTDFSQQQSEIASQVNNKKGNLPQSNKENINKPNSKTKQAKLFRSISNPKLTTSNSRNAILTQKYPPVQQKKSEQTHLEKLTQFIAELQSKDQLKNSHILQLKQENKSLQDKLQKLNSVLALKNKQIIQLNSKVRTIQAENRQKCQQYALIVESLKKVIESQVAKITQLTEKKSNRFQKLKNKASIYQHTIAEFYEEQQSDNHSSNKDEIVYEISSRSSNKNIESLLYEQQPKKARDSIQSTTKDLSKQQMLFQTYESGTYNQDQGIAKEQQANSTQYPTPNFGARTPKQSYVKSVPSESDPLSSLDCSLDQVENNLSLSRISQSDEEDFETSRDNIKQKKQNYQIKPNQKSSYTDVSTHQQLLDQIDLYLSKRTNLAAKK